MDQFTGPPIEFADAAFVPYGLDERWSGLRWFGGSGSSGSTVTQLVLAFGDSPRDVDQPEVRVETRRAGPQNFGDPTVAAQVVAGRMAREQVGHLWRETGALRDDVRRAAFPVDGVRGDPTVGWDQARLGVDGETVPFSVLVEGEHWVAQAILGEVVVGIQSRRWPTSETGLRKVDDFDPYVAGAREIRRQWPQ